MIGMKVEDPLDEATNFISWKSRVLILEENDLLKLVNEKVLEPDAEEDKSHWRKEWHSYHQEGKASRHTNLAVKDICNLPPLYHREHYLF